MRFILQEGFQVIIIIIIIIIIIRHLKPFSCVQVINIT